jgi:hypothetical protein
MDNEAKVMAAFKQAGKPLSSKEVAELSGLENDPPSSSCFCRHELTNQ